MRHIVGHVAEFGEFSEELTDVAEVVVAAAVGGLPPKSAVNVCDANRWVIISGALPCPGSSTP
jgi:hypothetical protein